MVLLKPNVLLLIEEAALKSFWRKPTLRKFPRDGPRGVVSRAIVDDYRVKCKAGRIGARDTPQASEGFVPTVVDRSNYFDTDRIH